MWYFSPTTGPQCRVSSNETATVEIDLPAGSVGVAERPSEMGFASNAVPAYPVKTAGSLGPGTEYWLP